MFPPSDSTAGPFPQGRSLSSITDAGVISKQPFSVRRPCVGLLGCELDRMHLVTLATADGQVAQRSATTSGQKAILAALDLPEPPRFFDFTVPTTG